MKSGHLLIVMVAFGGLATSTGCYYDVQSDLYPKNFCDTSNVGYAASILPILQTSCTIPGCHVPGVQGTPDFTTYDLLHPTAVNGALVTAVQWSGPNAVMPPSGKLQECDIRKIVLWVNAGAPNN